MSGQEPLRKKEGSVKPTKKKVTFRSMKTKLDQLCRALVMERDGRRCRRCGIPGGDGHRGLQWCHIYSRRYLSVRWDPLNSVALCPKCHIAGHHSPLEFAEWVATQLTQEQRSSLSAKLKNPGRLDYDAEVLRLGGGLSKLPITRGNPDKRLPKVLGA